MQVRDVLERVKDDKARQRGFLLELMAYKLKTMFEAKMKAMLGDTFIQKDEELIEGSVEKEELRATGDLSVEKSNQGQTTNKPTAENETLRETAVSKE